MLKTRMLALVVGLCGAALTLGQNPGAPLPLPLPPPGQPVPPPTGVVPTPLPAPECKAKVCVVEPKKQTKVCYSGECREFCIPHRSCNLLGRLFGGGGHGGCADPCADPCAGGCAEGCSGGCGDCQMLTRTVLIKRVVPKCDTTQCVLKEVPVPPAPCPAPCPAPYPAPPMYLPPHK